MMGIGESEMEDVEYRQKSPVKVWWDESLRCCRTDKGELIRRQKGILITDSEGRTARFDSCVDWDDEEGTLAVLYPDPLVFVRGNEVFPITPKELQRMVDIIIAVESSAELNGEQPESFVPNKLIWNPPI